MLRCPRCETRLTLQRDGVAGCPTCGYEDYTSNAKMQPNLRGIAQDTITSMRPNAYRMTRADRFRVSKHRIDAPLTAG